MLGILKGIHINEHYAGHIKAEYYDGHTKGIDMYMTRRKPQQS